MCCIIQCWLGPVKESGHALPVYYVDVRTGPKSEIVRKSYFYFTSLALFHLAHATARPSLLMQMHDARCSALSNELRQQNPCHVRDPMGV